MFKKIAKHICGVALIASIIISNQSTSFAYEVKPGDTLSKIARENKTTVDQIVELNSLKNANQIKVGQELVLTANENPSLKISKKQSDLLKEFFDATYYADNNPDVVKALGKTETALYNHFLQYGIWECRQLNASFNVNAYASAYTDLLNAFNNDIVAYYMHYFTYGKAEGRDCTTIEKALAKVGKIISVSPLNNSFGKTIVAKTERSLVSEAAASENKSPAKPEPAKEPSKEPAKEPEKFPARRPAPAIAQNPYTSLAASAPDVEQIYSDFNDSVKAYFAYLINTFVTSSTTKEDLLSQLDTTNDSDLSMFRYDIYRKILLDRVEKLEDADYKADLSSKINNSYICTEAENLFEDTKDFQKIYINDYYSDGNYTNYSYASIMHGRKEAVKNSKQFNEVLAYYYDNITAMTYSKFANIDYVVFFSENDFSYPGMVTSDGRQAVEEGFNSVDEYLQYKIDEWKNNYPVIGDEPVETDYETTEEYNSAMSAYWNRLYEAEHYSEYTPMPIKEKFFMPYFSNQEEAAKALEEWEGTPKDSTLPSLDEYNAFMKDQKDKVDNFIKEITGTVNSNFTYIFETCVEEALGYNPY